MPYSSSYPPVSIPEDVDLWQLLFERKRRPFPDEKVIFRSAETGRAYTFQDLHRGAVALGQGLKAQWGWEKGDVLALFTPNSIDTAVVVFGTVWAGGVVSPANPLYTIEELAFQLTDSGARALVTQRAFLPTAIEAARRAGIPEDRIVLVGEERDKTGRFVHFDSIRSNSLLSQHWRPRLDPKKDLLFLVYSSGTTGLPKGVCLSHYNLVANILQFSSFEGRELFPDGGFDGKGDKLLGVLPFFHIYGLSCCVLTTIYKGWENVVMERFDLVKMLEAIQTHRISFFYVPPPIVLALGKHPIVDKYDLSSLKLIHSAAAPLTRELTEAVWQRLKVPVKQGFGLSETSPVSHSQETYECMRYMGSIGKLAPNMEAKIVNEAGEEVPERETGELWLKGPNVFLGYLNNPERTEAAFSSCGFFRTGDIVRRDKQGNYYCVDRLKELIKYKGFPVPPAELEGLLVSHEHVADACVIGIEDNERASEVPRAYVVLRPGVEAGEAKAREIADWVATRVAPHKRLRGGVRFVDQVPKSPAGKILRRLMRDQARKDDRARGPRL